MKALHHPGTQGERGMQGARADPGGFRGNALALQKKANGTVSPKKQREQV